MKRMVLFAAVFGLAAALTAGEPLDATAAFEKLKTLAGEWQGTAVGDSGFPATVRYEVGSNGSIVRELLFPGTDHEMMSVYHLVGGELVVTHYCAMGNQPRMKLKSAAADELVFDFDGGTNIVADKDAHIHGGRIKLEGPDRLYAEWSVVAGGKPAGANKLILSRKK